MEFQSFRSLERVETTVTLTEKIDGTNAQICIWQEPSGDMQLMTCSRNRIITPEDDNHGFAKWAYNHKEKLQTFLGEGRHFGEWCGGSIARGYGLKNKCFALFNSARWSEIREKSTIDEICSVPVLYNDIYYEGLINEQMDFLKKEGSQFARGFMNPEGIVIYWHRLNVMMKKTYPEVKIKKSPKSPLFTKDEMALAYTYLSSERLASLLSKDEKYLLEFPQNMPTLARLYLEDLLKETEFSIEEKILKIIKKSVFYFVKQQIECMK
jgi:hypothetical protein